MLTTLLMTTTLGFATPIEPPPVTTPIDQSAIAMEIEQGLAKLNEELNSTMIADVRLRNKALLASALKHTGHKHTGHKHIGCEKLIAE